MNNRKAFKNQFKSQSEKMTGKSDVAPLRKVKATIIEIITKTLL